MNITELTQISKDTRKTREMGLVRIGRYGVWLLNRKDLLLLQREGIGLAELLKRHKQKRERRNKK